MTRIVMALLAVAVALAPLSGIAQDKPADDKKAAVKAKAGDKKPAGKGESAEKKAAETKRKKVGGC